MVSPWDPRLQSSHMSRKVRNIPTSPTGGIVQCQRTIFFYASLLAIVVGSDVLPAPDFHATAVGLSWLACYPLTGILPNHKGYLFSLSPFIPLDNSDALAH